MTSVEHVEVDALAVNRGPSEVPYLAAGEGEPSDVPLHQSSMAW